MTMITLNGIASPDYTPFENLSDPEKKIINIIKSTLTENEIPDDILFFRYTSSYLAVESFKTHPFARIKTTGKLWYIELSCGDTKTGKNFRRFEFVDISEIKNYKKEILVAFRFCDPNYFFRNYANVVCEGLDKNYSNSFLRWKFQEKGKFLHQPLQKLIFSLRILIKWRLLALIGIMQMLALCLGEKFVSGVDVLNLVKKVLICNMQSPLVYSP